MDYLRAGPSMPVYLCNSHKHKYIHDLRTSVMIRKDMSELGDFRCRSENSASYQCNIKPSSPYNTAVPACRFWFQFLLPRHNSCDQI